MTRVPERPFAATSVRVGKGVCALLVAGSVAVVTGCSSNHPTDAKPNTSTTAVSPAASPSAESTDPQAAEKSAVLEAYRRFWAEQVKAYSKASSAGTDLEEYATALALAETESDLKDLRSKGIFATGAPTHDVALDSFQPDRKVPYAKLTDCLDSSEWRFVYGKSGEPVAMPSNRLTRYQTKVEAEKWGKQWKVVTITPSQRAC